MLFGTSFANYVKWAARGFADPAAYILFIAGALPIVGATSAGPNEKFCAAFFGALLLALGIFMKPIVAPAAAVLLGGAGLAALYPGNGRGLPDFVSVFCRCSRWLCTTGILDMYSCCSAPMPAIPICW